MPSSFVTSFLTSSSSSLSRPTASASAANASASSSPDDRRVCRCGTADAHSSSVSPAAIAVPIVLILLAIAGAVSWLWLARRRQRKQTTERTRHVSWTEFGSSPAPQYTEKAEEVNAPSPPPKITMPRFSTSSQLSTPRHSIVTPTTPTQTFDRQSLAPSRPYSGVSIAPTVASPTAEQFNWANALFDSSLSSRRGSQATETFFDLHLPE